LRARPGEIRKYVEVMGGKKKKNWACFWAVFFKEKSGVDVGSLTGRWVLIDRWVPRSEGVLFFLGFLARLSRDPGIWGDGVLGLDEAPLSCRLIFPDVLVDRTP